MSGSQPGKILSPSRHLEICGHNFGFTTGEGGLLASSIYGPDMLLNVVLYTGQPPQLSTTPKLSGPKWQWFHG